MKIITFAKPKKKASTGSESVRPVVRPTERRRSHMGKYNKSGSAHISLRRRAEILCSRVEQAKALQAAIEINREEKIKHAAIERKLRSELAGLNRLGFEGV